jgi:hypothetical protein
MFEINGIRTIAIKPYMLCQCGRLLNHSNPQKVVIFRFSVSGMQARACCVCHAVPPASPGAAINVKTSKTYQATATHAHLRWQQLNQDINDMCSPARPEMDTSQSLSRGTSLHLPVSTARMDPRDSINHFVDGNLTRSLFDCG